MPVILTKHHGLGNDFLVLIDQDDRYANAHADMAVRLCDRRTGIGADGLIRLGPGLRMHLHNADGSRAEMSGNGIRCLAQAVIDNGIHGGPEFEIVTDAGPRFVSTSYTGQFTVDMGPARVVSIDDDRAHVDTGNPHLVMFDKGQDLLALGTQYPDLNVELISGSGFEITMRVHERGAGITQACGTGSCASAVAAHAWGLTGTTVTVHNPGGDLTVEIKEETVLLTGPAVFIARIEVPA
ncbi:MAG: diaminopimelate epimerase [Acidimicrobiia bacterium]